MKKVFLILFAFLFLGAFAKTQNHEANPIDDSNDNVAVLLFTQTAHSEGICTSYGHDLRYQDSQGHSCHSKARGYGYDNASIHRLEKGHINNEREWQSKVEIGSTQWSYYDNLYMRFAQSQGQAIRNYYQYAEIKNRKNTNSYSYQRTHNFSANILQYRPGSNSINGRSRHLETHNFKT